MKRKLTNDLRLNKRSVSNLNAIVAGGPPPPPGSNSCVGVQTCLTCEGNTCEQTCERTCA